MYCSMCVTPGRETKAQLLKTISEIPKNNLMKKIEYRCNRCLIIEEKFLLNSQKPDNTAACHKCGGLAIRLPLSKWKDKIFEEFEKNNNIHAELTDLENL